MGGNTAEIIREFVIRLRKDLRVERVILFGSRVREDFLKDSDYDLVIVSPDFDGTPFIKRMVLVSRYWPPDLALEALCYTPEEFEKKSRQIGIVSQAIKEGLEITA